MKVFITGVTGFLGQALARDLEGAGALVAGSSSRPRADEAGRALPLSLGDPVEPGMFEGAGAVVHCAWDLRPGSMERNVQGTLAALAAAAEAGVARQVFVSSHSAREDAVGEYGRGKFALEAAFLEAGHAVARPGLVAGPGGLFGRMCATLATAAVVPLIAGGRDQVALVGLADCLAALRALTLEGRPGAWNLLTEEFVSQRKLAEAVLARLGRTAPIVAVPEGLAMAVARAATAFGLRLPFSAEQIEAMRLNRRPVHVSHLRRFTAGYTPLEEIVAAALPASNP